MAVSRSFREVRNAPMRIARAVFALIASSTLVSIVNAAGHEGAGALLGFWQYDATKSSFRGAIPYQSATYTFENTADGVRVVAQIIEGRNQTLRFEYLDRFDGTFVPVTGNPFYDSESTVWKDAHTAERTERRDGQVTGKTVMTVAEDGLTFTATASRTLPGGRIYTSTIVWNRVDP